jgi:tetratricopeptide (TPR) repeat protein
MAKRWPQDPLANAYVAHVHLMKGSTAKAEQRLRRVLIADNSNQYAARNLMDLLLEGGNFETAQKIVRKVADHFPANQILCWQVTLAARQGQTGDAMRHFAKLCTCELDDMELTRRACDEMASHGMRRETLEIMEGSFTATSVNPCVGAIWVQTQLADKNARAVNGRLEEFSKRGRMGTRAISAYLGWLAQGKQRRSLRKCIDRYRSVLEADADAWGNVGNHLLEAEEINRAEEWLYELQDRAGARPWMLYNLSIAQRSLKIASGYRELHARALRMQPDNTYPLHRELQAHEEALLGNVDAAIALRTGIDRPSLDTWIQHVAFLTDACIIAQSRARGEQEYTFRDITDAVASAKSVARPAGNTILEWMHVRALKSIVHVSGPRGFAWYVGQRIQSSPWVWSIVIGAIVAILRLVFLKK